MKRSGLEVQRAAVKALFLRELKTRFGKFKLGYFWAILEPSAHLMVILVLFGYIMHRTMPGISFPVFILNGVIPYFIFSNISSRSVGAIEANQGLFNYRPVRPIDTIISRAILESLIYFLVYIILMFIIHLSGEDFSIIKPIEFIISWILLILLSCGVGMIFMVIGNKFPESEKLLPIVLKPLYFISGIMIPLHSIPKEYWPYVTWNPLLHIIEISRSSLVSGYSSDGTSLSYVAFCTLTILFLGLCLYKTQEESMLTS